MRARPGLTWLILASLLATFLAPLSAHADTNLEIGGSAVIAYANGDDVRLRQSPGYAGNVIRYIREGAIVDVIGGPVSDSTGNLWYQVSFGGDSGYIVSDYLALLSGTSASSPDLPYNPAGSAIGAALIAWTNNDGVRCRADAAPGAPVVTVVPEGTVVEVIGGVVGVWQPINCAGQSGFVHTDFVSYDLRGGSAAQAVSVDDAANETAWIGGSAVVAGTNGDGVRCRSGASYSASIITTLSEGSSVTLRDVVRGDFQGVVCAGENGYAASIYLATGGVGATVETANTASVTGSAVVAGTNGDGVRCRVAAGYDASVIVVLSEGTSVSLRAGTTGEWQPVVCGGSNGFISNQYLSYSGGSSAATGGDAIIAGTNGDGVRCRSLASYSGMVITVLSEGADVSTRGGQDGEWTAVICSGQDGWVHSAFDSWGGSSVSGGSTSTSGLSAGSVAVVSGTNGDGVRVRSSASFGATIIMVVSEGTTVNVIEGSAGYWVAVSAGGSSGFIHIDYLAAGVAQSETSGGGAALSSGDNAVTLADLNLRYDPSFSGGVAAVAPRGIVVAITGRISNGFYPVNWDGLQGYMHGDYLRWTDAALSERGGSGDNGGTSGGVTAGSSSVVNFAMQYLGYPYVWATRGPSSFDCSGFTYWVILNTQGVNIGSGTFSQIGYGTPIGRGDLQPGDLVFFQNTYTWGLSHVGIYIGDNQFVHAENESTGVVVSSLDSSYYASRWYGARRIG